MFGIVFGDYYQQATIGKVFQVQTVRFRNTRKSGGEVTLVLNITIHVEGI